MLVDTSSPIPYSQTFPVACINDTGQTVEKYNETSLNDLGYLIFHDAIVVALQFLLPS
jgi:hypothetical protein